MNTEKSHFNFSTEELNNFLRIGAIVCAGILALFLLAKTVNEVKSYSDIGSNQNPNGMEDIITVSGEAEMDVKPDITTFSWTVDATGRTVVDAQNKAAEIANKAIAFLKEKGIKEADLKTTGYYTNTRYETKYTPCTVSAPRSSADSMIAPMPPCGNTQSVPSGYDTTQTVEVKVRDIDKEPGKTSELIAGLGTIGAKASSPYSSIDEPETYERKVREEAIIKARQEAEILAKALGVRLVKITGFSENGGGYPGAMYDSRAMMGSAVAQEKAATPPGLPTGTNKVSSSVTLTYRIR